VLEQVPMATAAEPGTIDPTAWQPWRIWLADLYECRSCGMELITGFAPYPAAENFEDCFSEAVQHVTHTVNDC
jgi:hypothetical protein